MVSGSPNISVKRARTNADRVPNERQSRRARYLAKLNAKIASTTVFIMTSVSSASAAELCMGHHIVLHPPAAARLPHEPRLRARPNPTSKDDIAVREGEPVLPDRKSD